MGLRAETRQGRPVIEIQDMLGGQGYFLKAGFRLYRDAFTRRTLGKYPSVASDSDHKTLQRQQMNAKELTRTGSLGKPVYTRQPEAFTGGTDRVYRLVETL